MQFAHKPFWFSAELSLPPPQAVLFSGRKPQANPSHVIDMLSIYPSRANQLKKNPPLRVSNKKMPEKTNTLE